MERNVMNILLLSTIQHILLKVIPMQNTSTADDIVRMIFFLIDNIFEECGGEIFQQVIGIPMGTYCAPLLADIFLYSYEAELIPTLIKSGKHHLAKSFHLHMY